MRWVIPKKMVMSTPSLRKSCGRQSPRVVVGCLPMADRKEADRIQLLQGTLDLLILQTLIFGPRHGHGIATTIERTSEEVLLIDHGSLYPALQRLERAGLIGSEWGTSENNR